uniref:Uncharacterized protein n=1 Tax=Chromera velia CCMP2878 TaxID=1169474 RepID=A0A0G4HGB5_9ALVE|eukprot:Cvel_27337.t1-p1 / transcript=Cvel_27337.t1 / gene=Cvel_27337 / organism=Chromera_velia_CCMP2878 / gene_product=hypothetical protein / transcript_product=hypothetical protein / location=Cvel_scaffold3393:12948-13145(-) / protein_length=66 / sequence_SO=supercontig / SO=protein_coding / is_pseudo=false
MASEVVDRLAVIEKVFSFVWVKERQHFPFVLAGSYSAAVRAQGHDASLCLAYNDIDVWYECPNEEK